MRTSRSGLEHLEDFYARILPPEVNALRKAQPEDWLALLSIPTRKRLAWYQRRVRSKERATVERLLAQFGDLARFPTLRHLPGIRARGRPQKAGAVPAPPTVRTLDPALAEHAYQLHLDRKSDRQIATALLPRTLSREAARHRARRLIDLGERLHRKKIIPSLKKPVR